MARTKRKVNLLQPEVTASVPTEASYRAAGYIRLSIKDGNRPGSEILDGQKRMVRTYIENDPTLALTALYCDNGHTGTDFDRPEFDRLLEAIRRGEVNCVVVKDLSRFGRDYKETGNYLERVFPFLGVRFIAINDGFDTQDAQRSMDGYTAVLINIINEMYSKDLSAKLSATFRTKQKNGAYIGAAPPYGYRKCAYNINKLEPDPETAPIVQQIFAWKVSGIPGLQIARTLNQRGVSAPGKLHCMRTGSQNLRLKDSIWEYQRIYNMLRDPVYLGHTAQGRSRQSFSDGIPKGRQKREDWIVVENTHEPLVDAETFRLAQVEQRPRQKHGDPSPENLLRGLVFCADCGYGLYRNKSVSKYGCVNHAYLCGLHKNEPSRCTSKYINEKELLPIIWDAVQKEIEAAVSMEALVREMNASPRYHQQRKRFEMQYDRTAAALSRLRHLCDSLYQSYAEHLLSEGEYVTLKDKYQTEIHAHEETLRLLDAQHGVSRALTPENPFLLAFQRFESEAALTREMAVELIERIEIGEGKCVRIVFRYRDEYQTLMDCIGGEQNA